MLTPTPAAQPRQRPPPRIRLPGLLSETVAAIGPPDQAAIAEARERQERLTKPSGSLGMLEDLSVRLAGPRRAMPAARSPSPR